MRSTLDWFISVGVGVDLVHKLSTSNHAWRIVGFGSALSVALIVLLIERHSSFFSLCWKRCQIVRQRVKNI